MDRETIIKLARESGLHIATDVNWMPIIGLEYLERFVKSVEEQVRKNIDDEAKAHLEELRNNFSVESAELSMHKWIKGRYT